MLAGTRVTYLRLVGGVLSVRHRHYPEHKRQHREDERLDDADEQLKAVEDDGQDHRRQEGEHQDNHLPGEHVAEETECEAHQPHHLRYQLQDADEDVDRPLKELTEVEPEEATEHAAEVEELPP